MCVFFSETGETAGPLAVFDVPACPCNAGGLPAREALRSFGLDHQEMEDGDMTRDDYNAQIAEDCGVAVSEGSIPSSERAKTKPPSSGRGLRPQLRVPSSHLPCPGR